MLIPPDGLPADELVTVLRRGWGVGPASLAYEPVGWGSHHWAVTDAAGERWFVTADELEAKRHSLAESLTVACGRLRAALAAAVKLRECGAAFVVAPVPGADGEPVARANERFAVALYRRVDGESFEWGEFSSPEHRRAMLEMIIAVHAAPRAAARQALAEDFMIPHRDELEAALAGEPAADCGPYAEQTAALLAGHAAPVGRVLARYDELAALARAEPSRMVLTHGEPHPGNTMLAADGWRLIDWDTALVAPPERDLWSLDPGDGSAWAAYAAATGTAPRPELLEMYRIRWNLADIAVDVSRFRRPHRGTPEDDTSFRLLRETVEGAAAG